MADQAGQSPRKEYYESRDYFSFLQELQQLTGGYKYIIVNYCKMNTK